MKFKGLLKVALLLVAVSALFVACDTLAGGRFPHVETVYMKPGEDWASDKPVYAAWMWTDGKEGSWTELTKSTIEEDLWEVAVPSEIDNIIFVKMKDGTTKDKFSWDNKEEQTADLKVPYVFDKVEVYSIKAKEWIALGAKEPEKPVIEAVAISATEFTSLKYAAQNSATDIELDGDKSFTFYADAKTYKFKYTDGTWDFTAITGEAITELDKEYPITKIGNTGYDNIVLKDLTPGAEYKVTLTREDDGFAYVKVVATGNSQAVTPMIEEVNYINSNHGNYPLTKNGNIATATITIQETDGWNPDAAPTNLEFGICKGNNDWSIKYVNATITELNKEYALEKNDGSNNRFNNVRAGEEYKVTVDCEKVTVKLERTKSVEGSGQEFEYVEKVYLQLDNSWYNSGNRFAAYFFGEGSFTQWNDLKAVEGKKGLYEVSVPTGANNVIFCQMDPANANNDWGQKIVQNPSGGGFSIPQKDDTKVVYSLKASAWKAVDDLPPGDYDAPVLEGFYKLKSITGDFGSAKWNPADEANMLDDNSIILEFTDAVEYKFTDGSWDYSAVATVDIVETGTFDLKESLGDVPNGKINLSAGTYKLTLIVESKTVAKVKVEIVI